jgi:hypothetical protein
MDFSFSRFLGEILVPVGESALLCLKILPIKPPSKFQNKLQLPSLNMEKNKYFIFRGLDFWYKNIHFKTHF